jgi:hypothetical protein
MSLFRSPDSTTMPTNEAKQPTNEAKQAQTLESNDYTFTVWILETTQPQYEECSYCQ